MDPATHTLTGLMLSRVGLGRVDARAPLTLMLAANAPDLDGITIFGGMLPYIEYHRGWPHAIAFLPVIAMLPVLVVCGFTRRFAGWRALYLISLIAVASHLMLDWTNSYGIRLLLPFSSEWFHGDLNSLTDGWIMAALLIAWLMVYIVRLVNSEIGAKPTSGRALAIFALAFFLGFDGWKFFLRQQAMAMLNARIYDGAIPRRTAVFPMGSNPFVWRGWVETSTSFKRYAVNVSKDFDPGSGETYYKPDASEAIAAARATPVFQRFLKFNIYPRWVATPASEPEGATRVELLDLRLPFKTVAIVDRSNRVLQTSTSF